MHHCCNNGENYIVLNTFQHSSQQILTKERRKHNFITKQQKKIHYLVLWALLSNYICIRENITASKFITERSSSNGHWGLTLKVSPVVKYNSQYIFLFFLFFNLPVKDYYF